MLQATNKGRKHAEQNSRKFKGHFMHTRNEHINFIDCGVAMLPYVVGGSLVQNNNTLSGSSQKGSPRRRLTGIKYIRPTKNQYAIARWLSRGGSGWGVMRWVSHSCLLARVTRLPLLRNSASNAPLLASDCRHRLHGEFVWHFSSKLCLYLTKYTLGANFPQQRGAKIHFWFYAIYVYGKEILFQWSTCTEK